MKKSDFITLLSKKLENYNEMDISLSADLIQNSIIEALKSRKRVEIRGFGSFCLRDRKSIRSVDNYHVYLNEQVCKIIKSMGHTLLVKLHPGLYNSEFVKEELSFWNNLGANIIEPLDTFNMLSYVDLGISLKSQSSLDVNYFRKPFI